MLTDGAGTTVTGVVRATGKRRLTVVVDEVATAPEPEPRVTVVQALPKGDRGELAVEVLTEVGVATVVPVGRGPVGGRLARRAGREVAGPLARHGARGREAGATRVVPPRRADGDDRAGRARSSAAADLAVVLHEEATAAWRRSTVPVTGSVVVVVGPEGGLTDDEVAAFAAAGAHAVRLGDEVLRTSTAGVVAVAALLSRTGRWAT